MRQPLIDFIRSAASDTDVFCFQEALTSTKVLQDVTPEGSRTDLLHELTELLPGFKYFFYPMHAYDGRYEEAAYDVKWGNVIFIRTSLPRLAHGGFFAAGSLGRPTGNSHQVGILQYEKLQVGSRTLTVCNVHGMSEWPKGDTPERLAQSCRIQEFLKGLIGPTILCGDFNAWPDTESMTMLELGLNSLVRTFGIATTRSELNRQVYANQPIKDSVSDYIFTSPDIVVQSFKVPAMEISDHLPLILNFSLPK